MATPEERLTALEAEVADLQAKFLIARDRILALEALNIEQTFRAIRRRLEKLDDRNAVVTAEEFQERQDALKSQLSAAELRRRQLLEKARG